MICCKILMTKFKNKYRIESNRMPGWDYSGNGIYFITIVTQKMECILGEIMNGKMILSDYGEIVKNEWHKSFEIRQELILDEFMIMPNHLHAIVILKNANKLDIRRENDKRHGRDERHVETHGRASLQSTEQSTKQSKFYRKPKSLSSFIAGYKSAVTTKINNLIDEYVKMHGENVETHSASQHIFEKYNRKNRLWQPNYHDHIIRNDDEYWRIKKYIKNNPKNWTDDKFYG